MQIKKDTLKAIKKEYRVKNWSKYNNALIQRGSIELYFDQNSLNTWDALPEGKPGHQKEYSDGAIKVCLIVKKVFGLPLRQTQGFIKSIFNMAKVKLKVPNYTTICRRSGKLNFKLSKKNKEKVYAILDSTGLKVFGEGEWKVRKHGYSKRRTWKKLHISIDVDGEIRAVELTDNDIDDAEMTADLINEDKEQIDSFLGDGAYDKKKVYDLFEANTKIIVPPRVNAKLGLCEVRDRNIKDVNKSTLEEWKKTSGYHKRSLVETTMFRIKTIFGDKLSARNDNNQKVEARIICEALNKMTNLGMPESYIVN